MSPRPGYVSIRVTSDVPAELQRAVRQLSAHVDRNLTQSEVLIAALGRALADVPGTAELLAAPPADDAGGAALSDRTPLTNSRK